ncbi:MAG: YbhB/YbcL family Raf kinase inhibitor-like protein [Cellvibrionaceae bacterium]
MGFALSDMQVTSSAFTNGAAIPKQFTGEGDDVSPALSWRNPPDATKAFAIICHDPDAPLISKRGTYGFVHWTLYNVPGSAKELEEGCKGYTVGKNDFGNSGYGGPMPPDAHGRHHYFFWVLALDTDKQLAPDLTLWELLEHLEPHVIGMNRLVGTYQRD